MTNQLTQAELEQLAKDAGAASLLYGEVSFSANGLAKFAQLIQQRQGEGNSKFFAYDHECGMRFYDTFEQAKEDAATNLNVAREEASHDGEWFGDEEQIMVGSVILQAAFIPQDEDDRDDDTEVGTGDYQLVSLGNRPVDASQLVAQALEKAAIIVTLMLEPEVDSVEIAQAIRALIDQPVEPTSQESRQVEQGGDELVEIGSDAWIEKERAEFQAAYSIPSCGWFYEFDDGKYVRVEVEAAFQAWLYAAKSRVPQSKHYVMYEQRAKKDQPTTSSEDISKWFMGKVASQALANRRGGE